MSLLDLIIRAAGEPASKLISILRAVAAAAPSLAADAEAIIAKLEEPLAIGNLVAVAEMLPGEIANIVQGKLDPREHPSDAA